MEEAAYTFGGVAKILDIAESKLRYWAQVGFVGPSGRRGGKPVYSFQDLVSVKAAKELHDRGFKASEIRKALDGVRARLPHLDRPLDHVRVAFDGTKLVIVDNDTAYEASGQRVFDFGLGELAGKVGYAPAVPEADAPATVTPEPAAAPPDEPEATARAGAAKGGLTGGRSAYDWFVEGTRAEMSGGAEADARAAECYRRALELEPGLAAARTNLGSLAYRAGNLEGARAAFEAALALDPDQPEARFNLANLELEAGDVEMAVAEFRRVLQSDPDFADAHYNLAVALERLGGRSQARAHLERYIMLEAGGSGWTTRARELIDRLG
jgi:tetratricopeptide (TPR) repeat protein